MRHRDLFSIIFSCCVLGFFLLGCSESVESPKPSLEGVSPSLVCNEQLSTVVTVTGKGLSPVVKNVLETPKLFLPTLTLQRTTELTGESVTEDPVELSDEVDGGRVAWISQEEMTFEVDATLALTPGLYDLRSKNIDGQEAELPGAMVVVPPPSVTALIPATICTVQFDNAVEIQGEGFLIVEGIPPTITVGELTFNPEESALAGCFDLPGPTTARSCSSITVDIPQDALTTGDHAVIVTNPAPVECKSSEEVFLSVVPPPVVTGVAPAAICSSGSVFTITGENFREGASVEIGGTSATNVTWISDTEIEVETGSDMVPGLQDVTVSNSEGCVDTLDGALDVVPGPILFFVDPPVVYDGINTQVSLLIAGITGNIIDVSIEHTESGESTSLEFEYDSTADPNTILAIVPLGTAAGDYDVSVTEDTACHPVLENALTVASELTLSLDTIRPSFGWQSADTPIELRTADPIPGGQVGFAEIPRIYLNPKTPGAETVAVALRSTTFHTSDRLNAVVPSGLVPDTYDVIVVNPSGEIGLLTDGFVVTVEEPPTIDSVSPARASASDDTNVTANGANFRSPEMSLECALPDGTITNIDIALSGSDASSASGLVPSSSLPEGTICVVRITNDDGSYVDYSAISIGSPSGNLFGFTDGPDMSTARRAPSAIAGRATRESRYLYAIGGDAGDTASAFSSIEASPLDAFGNLDAWSTLPRPLPAPRTLASVVSVGRYLYLIGGNDGTNPTPSILRSQVLNPLSSPRFENLGITFGEEPGDGLSGGTWTYRISALFAPNDPINPDGESLASDPIVLQLPDLTGGIILSIAWSQVPDAVGYRVYRTPTSDSGSNAEVWLADVTGGDTLLFSDDASATPDSARTPLPAGALGEWADVGTLATAREGACATVATDPSNPNLKHIYIAGGKTTGGGLLDSIEIISITEIDASTQSVGVPTTSPSSLSEARWQCGAFLVDQTFHSLPAVGESYIYFGSGRDAGGGATGDFDLAQVSAGGALTGFITPNAGVTPGRAGYGYASASNFLYIFGGRQGNANGGGQEGELDPATFPNDVNWDALGGSGINTSRVLMGSAQESAVIFVVGGETDAGTPIATTESVNF